MAADRFAPPPLEDRLPDGSRVPWTGTVDLSDASHYDGPEAHAVAPWKCVHCGVENLTPLAQGCPVCGAGKPGYHVETPPPAGNAHTVSAAGFERSRGGAVTTQDEPYRSGRNEASAEEFEAWWARNRESSFAVGNMEDLCASAFDAGWRARDRLTMKAPPVTADLAALAPEGKVRRTLIAALELFRDQVLAGEPEEVETGEWCSAAEVVALVAQMKEQG